MNYLEVQRSTQSVGGMQQQAQPPAAPRAASQTQLAVEDLEAQHARIDALVAELERRISAILLPEPPAQPGGENHAQIRRSNSATSASMRACCASKSSTANCVCDAARGA